MLGQCEMVQNVEECKNHINDLKQLGQITVSCKIPLTAANLQDDWFSEYKQHYVKFFEEKYDDTRESLTTFVNILNFRPSPEEKNRIKKYTDEVLQRAPDQYSLFLTETYQ